MGQSRRRKVGIGCGSILLLLLVLFLALPTRKLVFRKHYDVVPISSAAEYKDRVRIERAHAQPAVSAFPFPIVYQRNGSLCGPTSLANVFRSFGEAGADVDGVLAGTGKCGTGICIMGLTLDDLAEVARKRAGYKVTVLRDLSPADFRVHLGRLGDPTKRYVANFDRGPLFGSEGGHHSPLGGHLADEDLVLVLDVNAKYEPWLVKTDRLFTAIDTLDGDRKRGLLLLEKE
jgi:hypothetical protein